MYLSDRRCNSSSVEVGVLTTITGHGPIPPEGDTHYHQQRASSSHYCTFWGSETPLTYREASSSVYSRCSQRDGKEGKSIVLT
ncbi:hypothetical protein AVEN_44552-1 [Araneus ventricosus]|uniref:Uncharacterized protein n=1 Tax=Araneus ventricosus TaxID=182803 RepID=A0A4Y2LIM4_ARAVE|nr:hypothetical protein AVEN_44552-1 [Araneus ventricosus]